MDHRLWLIIVLLRLRPHSRLFVLVNLDVNHVCTTADGAILHVLLPGARRPIDGDDDLLATCIAGVARFVNHRGDSSEAGAMCRDPAIASKGGIDQGNWIGHSGGNQQERTGGQDRL